MDPPSCSTYLNFDSDYCEHDQQESTLGHGTEDILMLANLSNDYKNTAIEGNQLENGSKESFMDLNFRPGSESSEQEDETGNPGPHILQVADQVASMIERLKLQNKELRVRNVEQESDLASYEERLSKKINESFQLKEERDGLKEELEKLKIESSSLQIKLDGKESELKQFKELIQKKSREENEIQLLHKQIANKSKMLERAEKTLTRSNLLVKKYEKNLRSLRFKNRKIMETLLEFAEVLKSKELFSPKKRKHLLNIQEKYGADSEELIEGFECEQSVSKRNSSSNLNEENEPCSSEILDTSLVSSPVKINHSTFPDPDLKSHHGIDFNKDILMTVSRNNENSHAYQSNVSSMCKNEKTSSNEHLQNRKISRDETIISSTNSNFPRTDSMCSDDVDITDECFAEIEERINLEICKTANFLLKPVSPIPSPKTINHHQRHQSNIKIKKKEKEGMNDLINTPTKECDIDLEKTSSLPTHVEKTKILSHQISEGFEPYTAEPPENNNHQTAMDIDTSLELSSISQTLIPPNLHYICSTYSNEDDNFRILHQGNSVYDYLVNPENKLSVCVLSVPKGNSFVSRMSSTLNSSSLNSTILPTKEERMKSVLSLYYASEKRVSSIKSKVSKTHSPQESSCNSENENLSHICVVIDGKSELVNSLHKSENSSSSKDNDNSFLTIEKCFEAVQDDRSTTETEKQQKYSNQPYVTGSYHVSPTKRKTLTTSLKYVESVEEKLVRELDHEPSKSIICKTTTNKNSSFDTHQPITALTNGKKSSPKHFSENPSILLNKTDKNLDTIPDMIRQNSNNYSSVASVPDTLTKNCTFTPIIDYLTSPKKQRLSKVKTSFTTNDSVNNAPSENFKNCNNSTSNSYHNETESIKEVFSPIKSCNNLNYNLSSAEPSFSSEYVPCDSLSKPKKCDSRAIKRQQNVALLDTNCTTDTVVVDKENEPNLKSGLVDIFGNPITGQASDVEEPFSKRLKLMKSPKKIVNRKLIFPDTSSIYAVKSPKKQTEGKFISVSDMNNFNAQEQLSDEQIINTIISASDTYSMKTEKQIKRELISTPNKNSIDIVKTPEKQIKRELISPTNGVKTPEKQIQMKLISTPNKNSIDFSKTPEIQIQRKLISMPSKNSIHVVNTPEKQIKMESISTPNKNDVDAVISPEKQVEVKSISESDEVITDYLMRIISKHSPKKLIHQSSSEMQVDNCCQEDKLVENISVDANFISSNNESDSKVTIDNNKSFCIFESPEKCMENEGMLSYNCDQEGEKVNNLIEQGNKKVNKIKTKTKLTKKKVKNLTKQKSVKLNKNADELSNKEKIFSNILNSKKKKEHTKQNLFNSTSENSSLKILPDLKDTKDFNNCVPETTLTTSETKVSALMDPQQLQFMDIQQQPQRTGLFKPTVCHISGESIKGTVILPSCDEDVINYHSDIATSVITEILNNVDNYDFKSSLSKKEAVGEKDNGFLHSISPNSFTVHTEVHSSEADENKYFDTNSKVRQKKLIDKDSRLNNSKNKSVLNDSPSLSIKNEFHSISSLNTNISATSKGTVSKVGAGFKDEDTIIYSPPMQAEKLELDVPINSANGDSISLYVGSQANSAFSNIVSESDKIMSPKPQRIIDNEIIKGNLSALSVMNQKDLDLSSNVETLSQNISITSNELEKNERVKDIASVESANNCTEGKVPVINHDAFVAPQVQTIKKYNTRRSSILSSISESENSLVIAEDIENENELVMAEDVENENELVMAEDVENENELVIAEEIENEDELVIAEEIENESPLVIAEDVENENPLIASDDAEEQLKSDPESSEEMGETVEILNKKALKTARPKKRKKTKSAANKRKINKSSNEAASTSKRKKPISSNEAESVNNVMSISGVLMKLDTIKYNDLLSNESHFKLHLHTLINALINPSNASDTVSALYQVFNYVSSSKKNPLMSFVIQQDNSVFFPLSEKCIVAAFHQVELKKKNHLTGLVSRAISTLYFLVLEKKSISKTGLGAFCRIFACLCKCGENKKKTLMLCCDLIKTKHPSAPYLIASIIGVWNELFSITDSTSELEKLLLSSIAYGVGKKPQTLNSTDWKQCKTLFSKYLEVSPVSDVTETSKILIDFLKNHLNAKSTETDYMVIEPLVIFSSFEGWNWAKETIINNFILPSMTKYAQDVKNERAFSLLCELYVEISLSSTPEYQEPCVTLWMLFMVVKAHDYVKECAARNLIKLLLLKELEIPGDLYQWVQENQANLVGTQIEFLLKRRLVGDDTTFTEKDISVN